MIRDNLELLKFYEVDRN